MPKPRGHDSDSDERSKYARGFVKGFSTEVEERKYVDNLVKESENKSQAPARDETPHFEFRPPEQKKKEKYEL
jgi:hypothetical protein